MSDRTALVLGAGMVGIDIARALSVDYRVHVHCRRRESVTEAVREIGLPRERAWHGDLVVAGAEPTRLDGQRPAAATGSALTTLVAAVRPAVVIDATNIATSSADRLIAAQRSNSADVDGDRELAAATAVLRGRAVELHGLLRAGIIERYLRISTTGLGSRGLEAPFTHGDSGQWLSPALWHKVLFAGMEHHILWALARSFPGRVNLVIPAAFVGFENLSGLVADIAATVRPDLDILAAGEDRSYTAEELAVLSSSYQMGAVTREDVTSTVTAVLTGDDTSRDVLAAMSRAALGPTVAGHVAREHVLGWIRSRGGHHDELVRGGLGARVSRALVLLAVLKANWAGPLWDRVAASPQEAGRDPMVVPADLVSTAVELGVPFDGDTPLHIDQPVPLCLCEKCLRDLGITVLSRLCDWYAAASTVDQLRFRAVTARQDWSEGDVLAFLWHGAGAETLPF